MDNRKLAWIGIRVAGEVHSDDIEKIFLDAVLECSKDYRLASLLFSWMKVHGNYVIVEKLRKLIKKTEMTEEQKLWTSALAVYGKNNCSHKWKSMITIPEHNSYLFPEKMSKSAIKLKGAEEWLEEYRILLPKGSLRIREEDIMKPEQLIKMNHQYKNRYLFGPSWRADIITAIQDGCKTPTAIVNKIGCSYEPAHRIFHEYSMAAI